LRGWVKGLIEKRMMILTFLFGQGVYPELESKVVVGAALGAIDLMRNV
jgi:hypothetical protein